MSTSKYKGKDVFVTTAGSEYVSMGGRDAEMTFGIGKIAYSNLYLHMQSIADAGKFFIRQHIILEALILELLGLSSTKVADVIVTNSIIKGVKYYTNVIGTDQGGGADMSDFGGAADGSSTAVADGATGNAWTATGRGLSDNCAINCL